MHILIVDDDREIRSSLRYLLEDSGYRVSEASDGQAALTFMRACPNPMIILLDLMMPRLDGAGLLKAVAQEKRLQARFAYILMTASHRTFPLPLVNLLTSLAVLFLAKPLDIDTLLQAVEKAGRKLAISTTRPTEF